MAQFHLATAQLSAVAALPLGHDGGQTELFSPDMETDLGNVEFAPRHEMCRLFPARIDPPPATPMGTSAVYSSPCTPAWAYSSKLQRQKGAE